MNVMAFGGGTNSLAMLVGFVERGESLDLILFADTGAEKPHTYKAVEDANEYCRSVGFPEIQIAKKVSRDGSVQTLEENCLEHDMLPSIAYGFKACSQKFKIQPQDKLCNNNAECIATWKRGEKITKIIGYDMDEPHRAKIPEDAKYKFRYPLIEWNWGRYECVEAINRAGLTQPGKSACFFCPSSRKPEIIELKLRYPDLAARAMAMEAKALSTSTSVKGLGRNFSWTDFLNANESQQKVFPNPVITECGSCYDGIHVSEAA